MVTKDTMDLDVREFLDSHALSYTVHTHPAVFTCEEAELHCKDIPGIPCKNLFLKDKKGKKFYLLILPASKRAQLNELGRQLGISKLRFANESDLMDKLKLTPGSVSILGLINDTHKEVSLFLDRDLWEATIVGFHPNINTATLEFAQDEFHRLVRLLREEFELIDIA